MGNWAGYDNVEDTTGLVLGKHGHSGSWWLGGREDNIFNMSQMKLSTPEPDLNIMAARARARA